MPYTPDIVAKLEANLPPCAVTFQRLDAYCAAAGINIGAVAKLMGLSASTLSQVRSGKYIQGEGRPAKTDVVVRHKIEDYIARHPLNLTSVTGDEERLYETENVSQIRQWFQHCHSHRALAFIYGPPGSQKSFVIRHLIAEFNRRELAQEGSINRAYYIYVSVNIQPRDLLRKMCAECGAPAGATLQICMASLRHHLRHTQTVFVLDEAQHASIPALEAIRELYDAEPHIGCLLMGSHGLKQFFDQRAAELEQWNSRIDAGVELSGVSDETARSIFAIECPELDANQVSELLNDARVPDPYSARRGHTYLSMRRVFKAIAAVHNLQRKTNPAQSPEVLQ